MRLFVGVVDGDGDGDGVVSDGVVGAGAGVVGVGVELNRGNKPDIQSSN